MNDDLREQIFKIQELNDFNPKKNWRNKHKRWIYSWLIIFLISGLGILLISNDRIYIKWILLICWIGLFITSFWVNFDLNNSIVPTNWDDMEYTLFKKIDIPFTSSDGIKHAAYLYIHKDIDFHEKMTPYRTVIGFHGWGAHHKEMDKYCLPVLERIPCIYFTMDSFGKGQTSGSKNNFNQFTHAKDFIDYVLTMPFVDKRNIGVVGMSLGAGKTAYAAYPNPNIRAVVMLSGPYDLILTKKGMTKLEYLIFRIFGFKFGATIEEMKDYSGYHKFNPDGIILEGESTPTPNKDRVFLLANEDDPAVTVENTKKAIEKLQLPKENYRIFKQGFHGFKGNEPYVTLEIYSFLKKIFS